jgi:DNA invertase Pin-like site-specific DNA recombinase
LKRAERFPIIAAIYARKSTEQLGRTVDESSIYVDDRIAGADCANRPGFLRVMNSLKPRPGFQVLVMSEESRLGREAIGTA